ncbi:hypothetical protein AB7X34_01995 [Proteus mirabilis]|uniref:hypothetical protein n=1 Tax=Morganellaceae TaxID=1903414 RepID=UPI00311C90AE
MKTDSTPSLNASQDYFTGPVRQDSMFVAPALSKLSLGLVTFEPCARTAWHMHPYGQMIIITAGMQKEHIKLLQQAMWFSLKQANGIGMVRQKIPQ